MLTSLLQGLLQTPPGFWQPRTGKHRSLPGASNLPSQCEQNLFLQACSEQPKTSHFSMMAPYCLLPASTAPSALPNVFCGGHFLCAPSRVVLCYGYFSFWDGEMQHREVQQFLHSLTAKNKVLGRVFVLSLACSALEPTPDCI